MSEPNPIEVPLLETKCSAQTETGKWLPAGIAMSGWFVAAAIAGAYVLKHVENARVSAHGTIGKHIGDDAPPLELVEVSSSDEGLPGRWVLLTLVRAAGFGQLALVLSSAAIPFLLDYKKELGEIKKPLLKQMFLVYSGYILVINFLFGLLSAFAAESIITVGFLPSVIAGFIFLYWLARLMIAIFVFDLSFLNRPHEIVGRVGIEILFGLLPVIYGLAFAHAMSKLSLNFTVPDIGPFGRMVVIIIVLFMAIKCCVVMMPKGGGPQLTWFQTFLFFFVWPGMQPRRFLERKSGLDWRKDACYGTLFIVLGFLWSLGVKYGVNAGLSPAVAGLLCLPAISMMGHVGSLRLLRCALRSVGYDVEQLFVDPLLACSMDDFWSKRWNIAFSDMNRFVIVAAVKTALIEDFGVSEQKAKDVGVIAAFVFSAILHELAITVPVLAGFGGPSLYFLIQACCFVMEKQAKVKLWRANHPIIARLLSWTAILGPFPICFVVPFRTEIALPLAMLVADLPTLAIAWLK